MTNSISFDSSKFIRFKIEYENSVRNNKRIFMFEGHQVLTAYAKYMIDYLKPKFEN